MDGGDIGRANFGKYNCNEHMLLLTPKQFGGVVIGVVQVFTFTGMALRPVIGCLYVQGFQTTIPCEQGELPFTSGQAYVFIFFFSHCCSCIIYNHSFGVGS
jgi:hypothetical protein